MAGQEARQTRERPWKTHLSLESAAQGSLLEARERRFSTPMSIGHWLWTTSWGDYSFLGISGDIALNLRVTL